MPAHQPAARPVRAASRAARMLRLAAGVGFAGTGLAAAAFSTVSYDWLSRRANRFAVGGDAGLTQQEFDAIVLRLRLAAALLIVGGVLLQLARRRVDPFTTQAISSWGAALRSAPGSALALARKQSAVFIAACGAVAAAALALRLSYLDVPLRYDEATTYDTFVSDPLHVSLANYSTPNNHPLHTLLAKVSVTLLGNGPVALRLPALVAGLLLVPATFALGWRLYGRSAALLAAAFAATSSTLVEYSTNARGYTLVALFTATGLLAATRIVTGGGAGAWAALVASCALGAFAVPVMLYAAVGIFVWLAASWRVARGAFRSLARPLIGAAVASILVTAVLYAPILIVSGPASLTSNEFVEPLPADRFLADLPGRAADTAATWVRDLPWPVGAALGVVLLVSLVVTPRLSRFPVPSLLAFACSALVLVAAQRVLPETRVWLFAVPVAMATVAGAIAVPLDRLRREAVEVGAAAVLLACGFVLAEDSVRTSRETGALLDAEPVAETLHRELRPGDGVVATGSDAIVQYYLERRGVDGSFLYDDVHEGRTFVVVNVLGGQTLGDMLASTNADQLGPARLVARWPSAELYVVRLSPRAAA